MDSASDQAVIDEQQRPNLVSGAVLIAGYPVQLVPEQGQTVVVWRQAPS